MLFVGDSVYPDGNDFAPFIHGIRSKPVKNEEETYHFLQKILKNPKGFFDNKFYKKRQPDTIPQDAVRKGVCMKSKKPQPVYVTYKKHAFNEEKQYIRSENMQKINIFLRYFAIRRTIPAY